MTALETIPMKHTIRILTIAFACLFAAAASLAQDADSAQKSFKALRDDKAAKPGAAYNQKLCDAGTGFLAEYSSDTKRAKQVINDLLSYGTGVLAKDKALRDDLYAKLDYAIVARQGSADDKTKAAFAALAVAVAEGRTLDTPNRQTVTEWRSQIDKLSETPGAQPYVLDREKGYFAFVGRTRDARTLQTAEAQLATLAQSKDRETANWAKQEIRMSELRKAPVSFAFTAFDGKQFDPAALKGNPAIYVYFWSTTAKNAAGEVEKLMDAYYDLSRRQVEFVAFCCDPEDKRADVQTFLKKAKIKCPVYFDGQGTKGELYQKLGSPGMLNGYLFGNNGMLRETGVKPGDLKKYIR